MAKSLGSNAQARADITPTRSLRAIRRSTMKRILIIAILAMAIPSLALAQTNDKKVAPSSKAEQEVVKASGEIIEALGRTDVVMLDRIYADDFITDAFSLSSKAQLMDAWKSGRLKYT